MDSDLQSALDELTQSYAAARACQAEWEVELKALLPRLESYERLGSDLQVFTQSRLKALSPVGQPDRSIDDYRQTIEVQTVFRFLCCTLDVSRLNLFSRFHPFSVSFFQEVQAELEQESGQLKTFCNLGAGLSQSKAFNNTQILLDNVKEVTDEFTRLEDNVRQR